LKISDFQSRDEHWVTLNLFGKGGNIRTVPVRNWVMAVLHEWLGSAQIDRGHIFREVSRSGPVWAQASVKSWFGGGSAIEPSHWISRSWRHTTFGEPALGFAMQQEANLSRSNFCWVIAQLKQQNGIWGGGSGSRVPWMTG